jgi:hypothetical protein
VRTFSVVCACELKESPSLASSILLHPCDSLVPSVSLPRLSHRRKFPLRINPVENALSDELGNRQRAANAIDCVSPLSRDEEVESFSVVCFHHSFRHFRLLRRRRMYFT